MAKPFKVTAGKYYRTRDGSKAYVAAKNPFMLASWPYYWIGVVEGRGDGVSWCCDGSYFAFGETPLDLVARWVAE